MEAYLKILNPVRILTVSEWMEIVQVIVNEKGLLKNGMRSKELFQELMQRWEELVMKPLKKSHFVCEVINPLPTEKAFKDELEKVWFEGFKNEANRVIKTEGLSIVFEKRYLTMRFAYDNVIEIANCTVYDLIYMIDRYNRTASTPIELKFTPAFVNQLLQ